MAKQFQISLVLSFLVAHALSQAGHQNYPSQSINLAASPGLNYYTSLHAPDCCPDLTGVEDFHAVAGIQTVGGGYVLVGKGVDTTEPNPQNTECGNHETEGFAVKISATGGYEWGYLTKAIGSNVLNGVIQLPNGEILVAGYRAVTQAGLTAYARSLTKLSPDGHEIWTATFGDAPNSHGAWEMLTLDSGGVLLSGVHQMGGQPTCNDMLFKSYGNVGSGSAVVMKLPLDALESNTAPSEASALWTWSSPEYYTAKTAHQLRNSMGSSGTSTTVALLQKVGDPAKKTGLVALTENGQLAWGPLPIAEFGEGTDLKPTDDNAFVVTGLAASSQGDSANADPGTYYARLGKYSGTDGSKIFVNSFSACGNPADPMCNTKLQYQECWGVAVDADGGYVAACGTGIENCEQTGTRTAADIEDCNRGEADRRTGAYLRAAGKWAVMLFKTDSGGNLLWQRVDSYELEPRTMNNKNSSSSAGEWVVRTSDGGLAVFTDEETGFGVMKLGGPPSTTSPPPITTPYPQGPNSGSQGAKCGELKLAFQQSSCCSGTPAQQTAYTLSTLMHGSQNQPTTIYVSNTATCSDLENAYKASNCCGSWPFHDTHYQLNY